MDKEKALEFTRERIKSIQGQTFENETQLAIAQDTLEYLRFIEKMLEK